MERLKSYLNNITPMNEYHAIVDDNELYIRSKDYQSALTSLSKIGEVTKLNEYTNIPEAKYRYEVYAESYNGNEKYNCKIILYENDDKDLEHVLKRIFGEDLYCYEIKIKINLEEIK